MNKKHCPFEDRNNDYCCETALHEEESYENCHDCAIDMYKQLADFIKYLRKNK